MKFITLGFACAFLTWSTALWARELSVITSDGRVVELNTEFPANAKIKRDLFPKKRLAFKTDNTTSLIYSASVDYVTSRLYISVNSTYASRGMYVFDLQSLKKIGFIPGITEITVPITANSNFLVGRRYLSSNINNDSWFYSNNGSKEYVFIERRNFRKLMDVQYINEWFVLLDCLTADDRTLIGKVTNFPIAASTIFDPNRNDLHKGRANSQRFIAMRHQGLVESCWPDGSLLAIGGTSGTDTFIAALRTDRKPWKKMALPWGAPPMQPNSIWTMGLSARFASTADSCIDLAKKTVQSCGFGKPNFFSLDRIRGYLVDNRYLTESVDGENRNDYAEGIDVVSIEQGKFTSAHLNLGLLEKSVRVDINFLKHSLLNGPESCDAPANLVTDTEDVFSGPDEPAAAHSRFGPLPPGDICKADAKQQLSNYPKEALEFVESLGGLPIGLAGVFER